jgi:hypothetical protein
VNDKQKQNLIIVFFLIGVLFYFLYGVKVMDYSKVSYLTFNENGLLVQHSNLDYYCFNFNDFNNSNSATSPFACCKYANTLQEAGFLFTFNKSFCECVFVDNGAWENCT